MRSTSSSSWPASPSVAGSIRTPSSVARRRCAGRASPGSPVSRIARWRAPRPSGLTLKLLASAIPRGRPRSWAPSSRPPFPPTARSAGRTASSNRVEIDADARSGPFDLAGPGRRRGGHEQRGPRRPAGHRARWDARRGRACPSAAGPAVAAVAPLGRRAALVRVRPGRPLRHRDPARPPSTKPRPSRSRTARRSGPST